MSATRTGNAFRGMTGAMVGVGGVTAALYATGRAMTYGVRKGLSYDRQLTLIQKTTKLTTAEMDRLDKRIKLIAETRGIDRDIVAGAGVIAGRLGITDLDDLARITEIAVKLEKSTDATADQAATSLARLHTLTGASLDDLERTADALVHIGNNSAIAEGAILDLAVPLAAVLGRFGAAPEEVLAAAAALGIAEGQAQGAATAWTRLLTAMAEMSDEQGPRFIRTASLMGRSVEQLGRDLKTDLIGTASEFLEILKRYDAPSQINILDELGGIPDKRSQQALFRTLPELNRIRGLTEVSTGALNTEEAIRLLRVSGQFDSSVEGLKAAFLGVTSVLDEFLLPAINGAATALSIPERSGYWRRGERRGGAGD